MRKKNGHVISYVIPKEELSNFMGKPDVAIPEEYLDRKLRRLSLHDLFEMKGKHPYPYMYASWFGHNAQVFQLASVDKDTGELVVLEEFKYYLMPVLEAIEQRLYDEALLSIKECRPETLQLYVY